MIMVPMTTYRDEAQKIKELISAEISTMKNHLVSMVETGDEIWGGKNSIQTGNERAIEMTRNIRFLEGIFKKVNGAIMKATDEI
jgi:hypothetical protein